MQTLFQAKWNEDSLGGSPTGFVRLWCHGSAAAICNGGLTQQKIGTHSRRVKQLVQPDSKQEEWQPQYIGVYTAHLSSHLPVILFLVRHRWKTKLRHRTPLPNGLWTLMPCLGPAAIGYDSILLRLLVGLWVRDLNVVDGCLFFFIFYMKGN